MPIIASHRRPDDLFPIDSNEEKLRLEGKLRRYGLFGSIPRRIVGEGFLPNGPHPVEVACFVLKNGNHPHPQLLLANIFNEVCSGWKSDVRPDAERRP